MVSCGMYVKLSCTTAVLTDSYLEASYYSEAGAAAESVTSLKAVKYVGLSSQSEFVPMTQSTEILFTS